MRSGVLRSIAIRIVAGFVIVDGSTFESIAVDSEEMENCQELTTFEKCMDNPLQRLEETVNAAIENQYENLIPKSDIPTESSLETQIPSSVDEESSSTEARSVQENSSEDASGENADTKKEIVFDVGEVLQDFTFEDLQEKYEVAQNRIEELEDMNENQVIQILDLEKKYTSSKDAFMYQEYTVHQLKQQMQYQKYSLVVFLIAHVLRFFW